MPTPLPHSDLQQASSRASLDPFSTQRPRQTDGASCLTRWRRRRPGSCQVTGIGIGPLIRLPPLKPTRYQRLDVAVKIVRCSCRELVLGDDLDPRPFQDVVPRCCLRIWNACCGLSETDLVGVVVVGSSVRQTSLRLRLVGSNRGRAPALARRSRAVISLRPAGCGSTGLPCSTN